MVDRHPVEIKGKALTDGVFMVAIDTAHEEAHAINLLTHQLLEHPGTRSEDLEIFADYVTSRIDFATYRRRIETGEA